MTLSHLRTIVLDVGIGAAIAGAVIIGGYKWLKSVETRTEREFQDNIVDDCVEYLGSRVGATQAVAREKLRRALDSKVVPAALDGVNRIECTLQKMPNQRVSRKLLIATGGSEGAKVAEIAREFLWEDIPVTLRNELMSRKNATIAILLADRNGGSTDD